MVDESGDQFVAYFLPTEDTLEKRRRDIEGEVDYEDGEESVLCYFHLFCVISAVRVFLQVLYGTPQPFYGPFSGTPG